MLKKAISKFLGVFLIENKPTAEEKQSEQLSVTENELIDFNLSLTPEERLLNHERALAMINEIKKARALIYGEPDTSSETPA